MGGGGVGGGGGGGGGCELDLEWIKFIAQYKEVFAFMKHL